MPIEMKLIFFQMQCNLGRWCTNIYGHSIDGKKNLSREAHKFWCIIIFNTIYGQDCDDDDDDDKRSSSSSWCCKLLQLGTCACARAQSSSPFSISYCLKHVVNALTLICTQNTHTHTVWSAFSRNLRRKNEKKMHKRRQY